MSLDLRIGVGVDVHRLAPDRPCMVGGVEIPSDVGPLGHSDGDAVLHALCDAVLGAAGLDDLGSLFPNDAAVNKDRPSADFCTEALRQIQSKGLRVISLDVVLETEQPRLIPYRDAIRTRIAELFAVDRDRVNLKGKSGEKVGPSGRSEAMRATAVALLAGS